MSVSILDYSTVLTSIPNGLRKELLKEFEKIVKNFREGRWEPAELSGGKFCEVVYCVLKGHIDGSFPPRPKKPARMDQDCKALENADATKFSKTIRVHIPRMLVALYGIRNDRSVGHVGGDVDPNHMDSVFVLYTSKWIMAELVRIFHSLDMDTASEVVDALVERLTPLVWEVGDAKRVLAPKLSMKDKTLVLLYHSPVSVAEVDLFRWVEHSNVSTYRRDVLVKAHQAKLIEYDRSNRQVHLSPLGERYVESKMQGQI